MRTGTLTNPELRELAEMVAERAEAHPTVGWRQLAAHLAKQCAWRGHTVAHVARRLERAAQEKGPTVAGP
jgi:hypothetical protein